MLSKNHSRSLSNFFLIGTPTLNRVARRTDGRTDRRGSRNSYLDVLRYKIFDDCVENSIRELCQMRPLTLLYSSREYTLVLEGVSSRGYRAKCME